MFNRFRNFKVYNVLKGFENKPMLPYNYFKPNLSSNIDNNIHTGRGLSTPSDQQGKIWQLYEENREKIIQGTKDLVKLVVQATKDAYKDAKYLSKMKISKPKSSLTVQEIIEAERIKKDLIKFLPYSAAMTLPGGLALLAFIKAFFPHGTPTYFMTPEQMKEQHMKELEKQAKAHGELIDYMLDAMEKEGYDRSNRNPEDMKQFFSEHKESLLERLDTKKMDSDMLKNASDFLMFEYVEGTYILNQVYRGIVNSPRYIYNGVMWAARKSYRAVWSHPIFNYQFKLNVTPFEEFKEELIRYQFEKHLQLLRDENRAIAKNKFGKIKEEDLLLISQERGHITEDKKDAEEWLKKEWTPLVQNEIDNEMLTFWYSVIQYGHS